MEERYSQYQLVKSKSGLTVPYIDDVYLHSMYSPAKEAEGFAKLHEETLKRKKNVIVLGLGFGYHVEEIAKILNREHDNYRILIIEPNEQLYKDFNEKRKFEDSNIIPIHTKDPESLFLRRDFTEFLLSSPAILKHDASFMLNKEFFSNLLQYKASTDLNQLRRFSKSIDTFVETSHENGTLEEYIESVMKKRTFTRKDFLTLAFNEIANS